MATQRINACVSLREKESDGDWKRCMVAFVGYVQAERYRAMVVVVVWWWHHTGGLSVTEHSDTSHLTFSHLTQQTLPNTILDHPTVNTELKQCGSLTSLALHSHTWKLIPAQTTNMTKSNRNGCPGRLHEKAFMNVSSESQHVA